MKCAFCKKTGPFVSVDLQREETVPDELEQFEVVARFSPMSTVIRCPRCRTFFERHRYIDNEILHESDEVEFRELSKAQANDLLRYDRKRRREFARMIDGRLNLEAAQLTPSENTVIGLFKQALKEELSIHELRADADDELKRRLEAIMLSLVDKGVVRRCQIGSITTFRIV